MTFDAGTWWLAVLLLGFVTAGLVYLLKRSLFGRIDKLDESMKEISENSVKKSDYESTVQSLQADIKQIRADYTPRAEHRKDLDECRGDIKQIKADYITKEDFFREQAKTDRKLDRIMDILLEMKGDTLNIYTHITDEMQENAAVSIDQGIAKAEVPKKRQEEPVEQKPFTPYQPERRRPGTGYLKQIKEDLWEGRYSPVWPDGKKHSRNVYAHTREECEEKLSELILQMKAEIAALRSGAVTEYPDGVSPKKKQLAAYLRENPGVSNKSYIARQTGMAITTVHKYYDEVRAELAGQKCKCRHIKR